MNRMELLAAMGVALLVVYIALLLWRRKITVKVRNPHGFIELRRARPEDLPVLNDNLQLADDAKYEHELVREAREWREKYEATLRELGKAKAQIAKLQWRASGESPPEDGG